MRYTFAPVQVVPSGSDGGLIAAARPLGRERPDAAGGRYIGLPRKRLLRRAERT